LAFYGLLAPHELEAGEVSGAAAPIRIRPEGVKKELHTLCAHSL